MIKPFYFWMAFASALGFVKVILLASILPSVDFGLYAVSLSLATFGTIAGSFGMIEATIKKFPRMYADGMYQPIMDEASSLGRTMLYRFGLFGIVAMLFCIAFGATEYLNIVIAVAILAYIVMRARIVSAVILATGAMKDIQRFSVWRTASALVLTLIAASTNSALNVIIGEIIACTIVVLYGHSITRKLWDGGKPEKKAYIKPEVDTKLYIATVLTSGTMMLDRFVVSLLAGPAVAGSYAFCMIFAQTGQISANIFGQQFGPMSIRDRHTDGNSAKAGKTLLRLAVLMVSLGIITFLGAWSFSFIEPFSKIFDRYQAGMTAIALGSATGILYFHVILEYVLIAMNKERIVLTSALSASIVFCAGFGLIAMSDFSLERLLLVVFSVKIIQTSIMAAVLTRELVKENNALL